MSIGCFTAARCTVSKASTRSCTASRPRTSRAPDRSASCWERSSSASPNPARVAIVGLGAGTLAAYARPGQRWTFYEIDPLVERIARDPRFFTYLKDCQADSVEVVLGDARLRFRNAPDHVYQLIVLDAFSSDSLPVHLFSREAIALYRASLPQVACWPSTCRTVISTSTPS